MDRAAFDRRLADRIARSPHGLVSASDRACVAGRHVPEARQLAVWLGEPRGRWMDLGTGGGLPGLVLASEHREAEWVLVDATRKKVGEVRRFAAELDVECLVVAGRAEALAWDPVYRGTFDGVVARAVAPLRVLVELARGFLRPEGRLVAVKGRQARDEAVAAGRALERTRLVVDAVEPLGVGETVIVQARAMGDPPADVPRRPGVPQRRPW